LDGQAAPINHPERTMDNTVPEGTRRIIDGRERVFYSDYWVKTYTVPEDTLQAKRKLIGALTRRLFNHVEHGLNIPGSRLNEARKSYEDEADPNAAGSRARCSPAPSSTGPPTSSPSSSSCRASASRSSPTTP
jgi:hypothetical protein